MSNHKKMSFMEELIEDTTNVYRTEDYIVKQNVSIFVGNETDVSYSFSEDTYYLRTPERDRDYEMLFFAREHKINGKRIKVAMFTRKYIE